MRVFFYLWAAFYPGAYEFFFGRYTGLVLPFVGFACEISFVTVFADFGLKWLKPVRNFCGGICVTLLVSVGFVALKVLVQKDVLSIKISDICYLALFFVFTLLPFISFILVSCKPLEAPESPCMSFTAFLVCLAFLLLHVPLMLMEMGVVIVENFKITLTLAFYLTAAAEVIPGIILFVLSFAMRKYSGEYLPING